MRNTFILRMRHFMALPLLLFLLAIGMVSQGQTVTSDLPDYAPGTTATITGVGFTAGEDILIHVDHFFDFYGHEDEYYTIVAADNVDGSFVFYYEVGDDEVYDQFILTATGQTSGLNASCAFTDGQPVQIYFATTGLPSLTSVSVIGNRTNSGNGTVQTYTNTFSSPGPSGATPTEKGKAFTYAFPTSLLSGAYIIDSSNGSGSINPTTDQTITINYKLACTPPVISNPGDQTICGSFTLPTITGTNLSGNQKYYNASHANGGTVITGTINSTQTVWIYDANGVCSDEESFVVTINDVPNAPVAVNYNQPYDGNSHAVSATVTGENIVVDWYADETGGIALSSAPARTNAGTTTAWAEAHNTVTGCKSATRTQVTVSISKVQLTVTADNQEKYYDGSVFSPFSATVTGFVNNENASVVTGLPVTYSGDATTAVNAGTYAIIPVVTALSATNYTFAAINGTLTIKKVQLTVTAENKSKDYDGAVYSPFTSMITGFVNNETISVVNGLPVTYSGDATTAVNAGTYEITPVVAGLSAINYTFVAAATNGTLTINKVQLTVTAENKSKDYDGAVYSPFTSSISGYVNSEGINVVNGLPVTYTGAATTAVNAGTYAIIPVVTGLSATNYTFVAAATNGTLTINKVQLTVTAENKSKDYNGAVYSPFTSSISGFVNNETDGVVTGSVTYTGAATTAVNAGPYTITPVVTELSATNYTFATVNGTLTINKVQLTVTAENKSKDYNGAVYSPFTSTISGYVNGEDKSVVTGSITYTGAATTAVNAGSYAIIPVVTDLSATNYTFATVNGTLTINKVQLTVTADHQEKYYDGSVFNPFTSTISGFVNNETDGVVTGSVTYSGAATTAVNAGSYAIIPVVTGLSATNYTFAAIDGTLTIKKVQLTVTAENKSKDYDGAVYSPFTSKISGFVNSENETVVTGLPVIYSGAATTAVNAGTYAIIPVVTGLSATNYTFVAAATNGTLTINKVQLTVTSENKSKDYDGAVYSPFTSTITGYVNSEDESVVTGLPVTYGGAATTAVNAGSYTITPVVTDLSATNYTFAVVNGTLTINKVRLTVTADDQEKYYDGSVFSPFTSSISGFVNNETDGVVTGSVTYSGAATTAVNAGSYTITPVVTDLSATNYTFATLNGTLTINKVQLTVTAENKSKDYNGAVYSPFTSTITGYVNGEGISVVNGLPVTYTGAATTAVNAGSYTITPVVTDLSATNYTFATLNGTLTINKVRLTVTADDQEKYYNGSVFSPFTSSITGFVNNETDGIVTGSVTYSGDATTAVNAGSYAIIPVVTELSATNYTFAAVNGTLTINKVRLTVTADDQEKYCGQANPSPLTASFSGFVNNENLETSGVTGSANVGTTANVNSTVGSYTITASLGNLTSVNYSFSFVNGTLMVYSYTVDVTISANPVEIGKPTDICVRVSSTSGNQDFTGILVNYTLNDGNSTTTDVTVSDSTLGDGTFCTNKSITLAEVYSITATAGCATSLPVYLAVYDPNGGFVTGGGWINSPVVSELKYMTVGGKANFGFVSKYKKGSQTPEGNTEFQFQAGNLNFSSSTYKEGSLVVAGSQAIYKGTGTINGAGSYGFMVSAVDGQLSGGGGTDKFRIKIWEIATGKTVYDNNNTATENATASTELSGGSIVIHSAETKTKMAQIIPDASASAIEPTLKVYPNPFTERLNIEFSNATDTKAKLEIYSVTGAKLQTLYDGPVSGGQLYNFEYVPRMVSSQVVFYHLTLDGKTQVGKVLFNEKR